VELLTATLTIVHNCTIVPPDIKMGLAILRNTCPGQKSAFTFIVRFSMPGPDFSVDGSSFTN
jgi:hypothetical protein